MNGTGSVSGKHQTSNKNTQSSKASPSGNHPPAQSTHTFAESRIHRTSEDNDKKIANNIADITRTINDTFDSIIYMGCKKSDFNVAAAEMARGKVHLYFDNYIRSKQEHYSEIDSVSIHDDLQQELNDYLNKNLLRLINGGA